MVRNATARDLSRILEVYASARDFMREQGNPTQWGTVYPPEEMLKQDIKKQQLYVVEEEGKVFGVFAMIAGDDPTYARIDGEGWRANTPYLTLHRVASDGSHRGALKQAVEFALTRIDHVRIDTHEDNRPMQHAIAARGFSYRGTIYLEDGDPRRAYDLII